MKNLKFILAFAMLLTGAAAVGAVASDNVTKVEAATSSFSVEFKKNTGSQDSSTAIASAAKFQEQVVSGQEYVTYTSGNNVYGGLKGLKFSSSSKNGKMTLKLNQAYNVSSIVLTAAKWKSSEAASITVNSATAKSLTDSFADYSFTIGDTIDTFSVSVTKRVYLESLTINYETTASEQYAFTFDANGGTIEGNATKTVEVNDGYEVAMPVPTNPGYRFLGWFTSPEGGEKVDSLTSSAETDGTTLYAHWEEIVEPAVLTKTLAEVIELPASDEQLYLVKGVVSNITNTTYGNFDLVDGDASIYVYGATTSEDKLTFDNNTGKYVFTNPQNFASAGVEEGDIITLKCFRLDYGTKKELNGVITNIEKPVTLTSIEATPSKTEYLVGDEFVKATVTATYSDGSTADVTAEATFTGYDMNTAGEQTVTVTYEGLTTTFTITVTEPLPTPAEKLAEVETRASVGFAYTKTGEEYSFSNVRISWRATVSAELIAELGEITAAGFECSIEGNELVKTINCTESIGTDAEGNTYIFGSLLIPSEVEAKTLITTKAFFEVGGEKVYLQETTHSFETAVKAYLNGAVELTEEQEEALNALAAAYNIVA